MAFRAAAIALLLAVPCALHAEVRLGRRLKNAMLHEPDAVPVLIRWKRGCAAASRRLKNAAVRDIPTFNLTAATLSARRINRLARSKFIQAIHLDAEQAEGTFLGALKKLFKRKPQIDAEEAKAGLTWGLRAIDAPRAWSEFGITGAGVRVGIVDSGLEPGLFPGRVLGWRDVTEDHSPSPVDPQGHGTHVAGTIAGHELGREGLRIGVAPRAALLIGRVLKNNQTTTSQALEALEYVADPDGDPETPDGAQVINGSISNFPREDDGLWTACIEQLTKRNIVCVFSAGNNGLEGEDSVGAPGVLSCSFTIGSVNKDVKRAADSSYGAPKLGNRPRGWLKPDLMGPGVDILSFAPGGHPAVMSGTSMATPHVAGVAALVREANPSLSVKEVRELLEDTALVLGDRHKSSEYGAGLVNAGRAVARARELAANPPAEPTVDDLLSQGAEAVANNNLPRAVDRYLKVIQRERTGEKAQRAMFELGMAYAQQGNYRAAASSLRKVLEAAPDGSLAAQARFQLALAYRSTPTKSAAETVKAMKRAVAEFDLFLKSWPDHELAPVAHVERALALADAGDEDAARAAANLVLEKWGSRPEFADPAKELLARLDHEPDDPLGD